MPELSGEVVRVRLSDGLGDLYEWTVHYSKTETTGTRIFCEKFSATIFAEDENEVREMMAEEQPDKSIDKITRGKLLTPKPR